MDDYRTDDIVVIHGVRPVSPETARSYGARVATRLAEESLALFGFRTPLATSASDD